MIVTCKECDTSFNFPEKHVKESGTKVRCSKCSQIFTVFPAAAVSSIASDLKKSPASGAQSPSAGDDAEPIGGLDDIDLNEIENMLDLDDNTGKAESKETASDADEFKLDFDLDESSPKDDSDLDLAFDETAEFDMSDLDSKPDGQAGVDDTAEFDFNLSLDDDDDDKSAADATGRTGSGALVDSDDELNFDLDLGLDDAPASGAGQEGSGQTADEDLELDIDFDFDDSAKSDTAQPELDLSDTQEFDLDNADNLLDLDEVEAVEEVDGDNDDLADFDLGIEDDQSATADAAEEVDADGLEDLDDFELDLEETPSDAASMADGAADEADDLDFNLDLDEDDGSSATGAADEDLGAEDDLDDLEFELDIESDDYKAEDIGELEADQTSELDLSDLVEIIEDGTGTPPGAEDGPAKDVDFELDLEFDSNQSDKAAGDSIGMDETDDFDLSSLEDSLDDDLEPDMDDEEDADNLEDLDLEIDMDDELLDEDASDGSDFEVNDLDDMLVDDGEFAQDLDDSSQSDDFGLELDMSDVAETSHSSQASAGEGAGLDDMLEMDDDDMSFETPGSSDDGDLGMQLDDALSSGAADGDAADIELDFELDESEIQTASQAAADQNDGGAPIDAFDLGAMTGSDETEADQGLATDFGMQDDEFEMEDDVPQKKGGLLRALLVILLLFGGGYGAMIVAQAAGFSIPYVPELPGSDLPFLTNLMGGQQDKLGNLKIAILEDTLEADFVENPKVGTLFFIQGKVENNYNGPRQFIQLTGKIYADGQKTSQTQKAYAGNVISGADLKRLSQKAIENRMKNRFGSDRSNLNVKAGASIPFMIVFTNLPEDMDEYTVEVAGSKAPQN